MNNVDKALEKSPALHAEDMTTGGEIITPEEWTTALVFARGRRRPITPRSLQSGQGIRRPRRLGSIETPEG